MHLGFTLVELSIVLVIIGLLVGGVLVGRDMIISAEITGTLTQKEEFNAAALTFKNKYGYLPGDLPNADQFGFSIRWTGRSIGDGMIGLCFNCLKPGHPNFALYNAGLTISMERVLFWQQLLEAELVEFETEDVTFLAASNNIGTVSPKPKIRAQTGYDFYGGVPLPLGWGVAADVPVLFREVGSAITTSTVRLSRHNFAIGIYGLHGKTYLGGMFPIDMLRFDVKADDGLPMTGEVLAYNAEHSGVGYLSYYDDPSTATSSPCIRSDITPFQYNADGSYEFDRWVQGTFCGIVMKAAF